MLGSWDAQGSDRFAISRTQVRQVGQVGARSLLCEVPSLLYNRPYCRVVAGRVLGRKLWADVGRLGFEASAGPSLLCHSWESCHLCAPSFFPRVDGLTSLPPPAVALASSFRMLTVNGSRFLN